MTELIVDRLRIEGFRGIAEPLSLDLGSPLTILYAANGTGKTTVCDAVEWLLTGDVGRLPGSGSALPLQSRFSPEAEPRVGADLRLDGAPVTLDRGMQGARTSNNGPALTPSEWLERIAPRGASSDKRSSATVAQRQEWVRATRFLTAESLAALLDTDEETVDRRKRVFADLLGVRRHHDAQQRLRRYAANLQPDENSLDRRVRTLEEQVERMRAEETADGGGTTSVAEWEAAERLLGLTPEPGAGNRADLVAGGIGRRAQGLATARDALRVVERDSAPLDVLSLSLSDAASREASAVELRDLVAARTMEVAALKGRLDADALAAGRTIRDLSNASAPFSAALARLCSDLNAEGARAGLSDATSYDELLNLVPETGTPELRRRQLASEVDALVGGLAGILGLAARRREIEAEQASLRLRVPDLAARDHLAAEVSSLDAQLAAARARSSIGADALQRLRSAVDAVLGHRHESSDCPVCGHNWGGRRDLELAIGAVVDRTPALLAATAREVDALEADLASARGRSDDAAAMVFRQAALEVEAGQLSAAIADHEGALRSVGVDPSASDVAGALGAMAVRLRVARSIREVAVAWARLPATGPSMDGSHAPAEALAIFQEQVEEHLGRAADSLRTIEGRRAEAEEELTVNAAELRRIEFGIEEERSLQATLRARIEALEASWRTLSPWCPDGDHRLEGVRSRLGGEQDIIEAAQTRLAAGNAAAEQQARRARLGDLETTLEVERVRLAGLRGKRRAAERAIASIEEHSVAEGRRQVEELIDVVNPLFARMHANKVFDRIDLGDGNDLLRWRSSAGDRPFDPSNDFSQGQRQDLALSLFIARARGLGGTFFLDEPVVHLDDFNRVGLLDVIRAAVLSARGAMKLVVTTSSRSTARHMIEKFQRLRPPREGDPPPLRLYELRGNGRRGIESVAVYPRNA